jgi:hypothetical protein
VGKKTNRSNTVSHLLQNQVVQKALIMNGASIRGRFILEALVDVMKPPLCGGAALCEAFFEEVPHPIGLFARAPERCLVSDSLPLMISGRKREALMASTVSNCSRPHLAAGA